MTRAKALDGLTLQETRFVEAYLGKAEGNATRAAEIARYKARDRDALSDTARRLMRKPRIKAALELRVRHDPLVLDRVALQHFWSAVVAGHDFPQIVEGACVTGPASVRDRLKASELLAKTHRMFAEESGTSTPTVRIVVEIPDNGRDTPPTIDVTPEPGDDGGA